MDPKLTIRPEVRARLEHMYLSLYREREELQQSILLTPDSYKNAVIQRETELVTSYELQTLLDYILRQITIFLEEKLKELTL